MKIDKKDQKIIEQLKDNSRASIRDISKATGLRPSTVHQRLGKLIKNKVIDKFTIKLNNKEVGENFIVFMLVETGKTFPKNVFDSRHIKEVFGVTGEYDMLLKMKFKDVEEFNLFVIKFRKEYGLKKTVTMVATAEIKEEI